MTMALRIRIVQSRSICLLLVVAAAISTVRTDLSTTASCEAEGTCTCNAVAASNCQGNSDIYAAGGTAMAYTPISQSASNANGEVSVCQEHLETPYKVASWFGYRSVSERAPSIRLSVQLQECVGRGDETCCCHPLLNRPNTVQIWQARPNGQYSSLKTKEGDCRAKNEGSTARMVFSTLAPGSTGSLGGLGPGEWDTMPYGAPVIHVMVQAAGYATTLVDIPFLIDRATLEPVTFRGPDIRGMAWVQSQPENPRYRITSWQSNVDQNMIDVSVDVLLAPGDSGSGGDKDLCSAVYGLPTSFFREPIAVCAPSMQDFFTL